MRRDICPSICQVHWSTRISKGARREIAVDSDSYVHLKQTTALLVYYYYSGPVGARVIKDVRFQFFFFLCSKMHNRKTWPCLIGQCTIESTWRCLLWLFKANHVIQDHEELCDALFGLLKIGIALA